MKINYSKSRLVEDANNRSHISKLLHAIKDSYQIANKTILELGSGMGQNLEIFRDNNKVIAFEGLHDVVMELRKKGIDAEIVNLEEPLDNLQSESIDVILCLDVLEHLNKPFELVQEMNRVLKKGGYSIINVPNQLSLKGRLKILLGYNMDNMNFFPEANEWDNPHIRFYTFKGLSEMFSINNLVLDKDFSSEIFKYLRKPFLQRMISVLLAKLSVQYFAPGFFVVFKKA